MRNLLFLAVACSAHPGPGGSGGGGGPTSPTATVTPTPTTPVTPCTETVEQGVLGFTDCEPPRNVFLLSIDTLRRDHFSRWGGQGVTPYMDQLIDEGVVLDNHTQCSNWTYAGMTCTTLGRPGLDLDWVPELTGSAEPMPESGTLPGWLSDAGYYTLVNSLNGWFSDEWNTLQGYQDRLVAGGNTKLAMLAAADQLQAHGTDDPWFVHVHVIEPHAPYVPPDEYLEGLDELEPAPWDLTDRDQHYFARDTWPSMSDEEQALLESHLRVRYAGEVAWVDDLVKGAIAELDARGLLEDTIFVVFSDHGESFWEHGNQTHAHTLHADENNGLLFFWAKDILPGVWSGPTTAIDLAPTLLDLLGVPIPAEVEGIPLGQAEEDRPRFHSSMARQGTLQSVVHGDLKLHFSWRTGALELYDRSADAAERADLYDPKDERVVALWALLRPEVEALALVLGEEPIWPEIDNKPK
jgi:arylsulfatase A-like enzyme